MNSSLMGLDSEPVSLISPQRASWPSVALQFIQLLSSCHPKEVMNCQFPCLCESVCVLLPCSSSIKSWYNKPVNRACITATNGIMSISGLVEEW